MSADDGMCAQPHSGPQQLGAPVDDTFMVDNAIHCLAEASRLRADANLMAKIRARIRERRDQLAGLLDEL